MAPKDDTAMEVDPVVVDPEMNIENDEEEEEDISELEDLLEQATAVQNEEKAIPLLAQVIETTTLTSHAATQLKERAVYDLTRAYCATKKYDNVVCFLEGPTGQAFLSTITKAKTAKVVRQLLDILIAAAPDQLDMHETVARNIVAWTEREKRTFLRQRVQAKLAAILVARQEYKEALELTEGLLKELKQLDDKQLLVETHLTEAQLQLLGLRNIPKAKAALTASRTAANAIYVAPALQAQLDVMSGTLHVTEGDVHTAHSYFLEAFEQWDGMKGEGDQAATALKYMMLCKILEALQQSTMMKKKSSGIVDLNHLLTPKQELHYHDRRDVQALIAIAKTASARNWKPFATILQEYEAELKQDTLIHHHLHLLSQQLLQANLLRLIEPYSRVELQHLADLIELPLVDVERKCSQLILDGQLAGILDQGQGHLIIYENDETSSENKKESMAQQGLQVIAHMDHVVTSLLDRGKALRLGNDTTNVVVGGKSSEEKKKKPATEEAPPAKQ